MSQLKKHSKRFFSTKEKYAYADTVGASLLAQG